MTLIQACLLIIGCFGAGYGFIVYLMWRPS